MKFNELQKRFWAEMIRHIEEFRNGNIRVTELVYSLEGALDAREYKNKEFVDRWYSYWTPLEIWASTMGDGVTFKEVNEAISRMDGYLKDNSNFQ